MTEFLHNNINYKTPFDIVDKHINLVACEELRDLFINGEIEKWIDKRNEKKEKMLWEASKNNYGFFLSVFSSNKELYIDYNNKIFTFSCLSKLIHPTTIEYLNKQLILEIYNNSTLAEIFGLTQYKEILGNNPKILDLIHLVNYREGVIFYDDNHDKFFNVLELENDKIQFIKNCLDSYLKFNKEYPIAGFYNAMINYIIEKMQAEEKFLWNTVALEKVMDKWDHISYLWPEKYFEMDLNIKILSKRFERYLHLYNENLLVKQFLKPVIDGDKKEYYNNFDINNFNYKKLVFTIRDYNNSLNKNIKFLKNERLIMHKISLIDSIEIDLFNKLVAYDCVWSDLNEFLLLINNNPHHFDAIQYLGNITKINRLDTESYFHYLSIIMDRDIYLDILLLLFNEKKESLILLKYIINKKISTDYNQFEKYLLLLALKIINIEFKIGESNYSVSTKLDEIFEEDDELNYLDNIFNKISNEENYFNYLENFGESKSNYVNHYREYKSQFDIKCNEDSEHNTKLIIGIILMLLIGLIRISTKN